MYVCLRYEALNTTTSVHKIIIFPTCTMSEEYRTQSFRTSFLSNIYNTSGRSVSVYTDTSAFYEYLCTLIQN